MEFFEYDKVSVIRIFSDQLSILQQHGIRVKFVEALEKEFPDLGLKFSIGKKRKLSNLMSKGLLQAVKSVLTSSPLAGTKPFAYDL